MYRFAKTGEIADPCGVPRSRICKVPSACCNGADSHRFTYSTTHGSVQCASTALTIRSHGTESKNFSTSRSMTQSLFQHRRRHAATVWAILSEIVGTPSTLVPEPWGLGISTAFTGGGK